MKSNQIQSSGFIYNMLLVSEHWQKKNLYFLSFPLFGQEENFVANISGVALAVVAKLP